MKKKEFKITQTNDGELQTIFVSQRNRGKLVPSFTVVLKSNTDGTNEVSVFAVDPLQSNPDHLIGKRVTYSTKK